jgi:hypothetical protein
LIIVKPEAVLHSPLGPKSVHTEEEGVEKEYAAPKVGLSDPAWLRATPQNPCEVLSVVCAVTVIDMTGPRQVL